MALDVDAGTGRHVSNPLAYIPPQCFTDTRSPTGPKNPCYVCHADSPAPNFSSDSNLQTKLAFPVGAVRNLWSNLFAPPITHAPAWSDADIESYVRQSNYLDANGDIVLAKTLTSPPPDWDIDGNGVWTGFVPDVGFLFDRRGFDHARNGARTGWRAFAYYPFPGTFFPTNGSADDVLIRLDARLQRDRLGYVDPRVYELNLAIVEALVTRADVPIDPIDEAALGVDVDLDGRFGHADHVAFDPSRSDPEKTRMRYAGQAGEEQRAGHFPIAPGLFPLGTEFFHTVRYLDVADDGTVGMAARMKEVRYARKTKFLGYEALRRRADEDVREQARSRSGGRRVKWGGEEGIDDDAGWVFQGFIEDARGELRPQSHEESIFCAGCHGGIGATTDAIFSFPRKLGAGALARGWYHWSRADLRGLAEPKRSDGEYEYTLYLRQAGAGDELRENTEVTARFFDGDALRPPEVERLHHDVSRLLLPSAARALDLDRAYRAVVVAQSFDQGRDAVLARSRNVRATITVDEPTGIRAPVPFANLRTSASDARK